jgi:hypothetical protein
MQNSEDTDAAPAARRRQLFDGVSIDLLDAQQEVAAQSPIAGGFPSGVVSLW